MSVASSAAATSGEDGAQTAVTLVIRDVNILFVPILEQKQESKKGDKDQENLQETMQSKGKRAANERADLQPRDMQSIDQRLAQIKEENQNKGNIDGDGQPSQSYMARILDDMMTKLFKSFELEISNVNIRVMSRDQKRRK